MIIGYKCFNKGLTNRYGTKFELNKTYKTEGQVKFGTNGNGFHMCTNIEDTFRYFDTFNNDVEIGIVIGFGNKILFEDEYNGYYDMYSVEKIKIIQVLSRQEIINIGLNLSEFRAIRFIQGFKLTPEEIILFKLRFCNNLQILKTISYYQEGDLTAYEKDYVRSRNKNI